MNSLYHANTKSGKQSRIVLTGDSDNYFNDMTSVKIMKDNQAGAPVFSVLKYYPVGTKKRHFLIRYKVARPVKGTEVPGSTPPESGAVSITLENPPATTVVGVDYSDDDDTP